jgi:hypothetical protein
MMPIYFWKMVYENLSIYTASHLRRFTAVRSSCELLTIIYLTWLLAAVVSVWNNGMTSEL